MGRSPGYRQIGILGIYGSFTGKETVIGGAKVLVAGGSGFVGVNLVLRLMSEGYRVRATLHKRPAVIQDPNVEYVAADLTLMEDCKRAVEGVDYVFMCAASTSGAAVIRANPLLHVTPNVVMNAQLLEAAYFAKVKKFLWLSSNAVYPPTGDRAVKEEELLDGDP
ncbi:MAG: NAD-dependent epimerase/dehydratase family protein, partial [Planctomycetes bacterium]|nr:NAD-dependent epimerase/dehydratase family protein [Planctomycetota bacterium]